MTTVQLVIKNNDHAFRLSKLLSAEEGLKALIVDKPDSSIPGLIVVAESRVRELAPCEQNRLIIVADAQDERRLQKLWSAGFRNVVFEDDSPETICLAIMAAHLRVLKGARHRNCFILDGEGVTSLKANGLQGPFALTDNVIDGVVRDRSPGAFVLDREADGTGFRIVFVGRSDLDVNNQLHVYVGAYKRFMFVYCSSAQAAFEKQCLLFHDFDPDDNMIHPGRPTGTNWNCPRCKLFG